MKKLSSKQIFTYVALLGILILVLVYMFVYQKNVEKTEALRSSNENLQRRVDSLKVYYDNEAQYLADMEPLKENIDKILEKYPAGTQEEDVIMQAVITEMTTPIVYSSINLGKDEPMMVVGEEVVKGANIEKYQEQIRFVKHSASYSNTLDYESLKMAIQSLFDSNYLIDITGITYAKSGEEGELTGTLDLVFFSVEGTEKEYQLPDILPYMSGVNNIFGVIEEEEEE